MTRVGAEERVVEGHLMTGERVALQMANGRIAGMRPAPERPDSAKTWLAPGLVDLQVNGYCGVDFNALPPDGGGVERVTRALWREGTTSYFPTVITNSDAAIERSVRIISRAGTGDASIERSVAGIHLEGPFISPDDGPRGAHDKAYAKAPDWDLFRRWQEAAGGTIRVVTLSPEWPGSTDFIARCAESGVTVSIGHTAASPEQIREAVAAGARMSTHLGNGAHPRLPRHPNYVWEQLAQDGLWTTVIADGFHLPESVLKVVIRVKGRRAMLVSDAVSFAGMEPGAYDTHVGGKVVLTPEGRLHLAGTPELLAGSVKGLKSGVEHLTTSRICEFPEAWEMASVLPASFMGLPQGAGLSIGAPADLVVLRRADHRVEILRSFVGGRVVYDESGKEDFFAEAK